MSAFEMLAFSVSLNILVKERDNYGKRKKTWKGIWIPIWNIKYACYTLNYINTDPAEHVHTPRIDKIDTDPAHIFTQEEIERILERFKGTHSIYYSFLTAYYTGMRVSEVYGLTWDCIDFNKKDIDYK